jgi:hypothetical protein
MNGNTIDATKFVGFAAREAANPQQAVQILLDSSETGLVVTVGNEPVTTYNSRASIATSDVEVFYNVTTKSATASFSSGWAIRVEVSQKMLSLQLAVPDSAKNKVSGLLGTYNDDPTDDFTLPDGTVLAQPLTESEIFTQFGMIWAVTDATTIFTYPSGKSTADYSDPSFTPVFEPDCSSLGNNVVAVCGDDSFCAYDYCVTNDPAVANNTRVIQITFEQDDDVLVNSNPVLSIIPSSTVEATVGQLVSLTVTAADADGDVLSYGMETNATGALLDQNTREFTWTPASTQQVYISFFANDDRGGAALENLTITICSGCEGHGVCNFAASSSVALKFRRASCDCNTGYTGASCAQEINACLPNPCGEGTCTDQTPQQEVETGKAYLCACPPGYTSAISETCEDVNECLDSNSCSHNCSNTQGSYTCLCPSTSTLSSDGSTCTDVDECEKDKNICGENEKCVNADPGYTCECLEGYNKTSTGACQPIFNCTIECQGICVLVGTEQRCHCPAGYSLNSDGKTCSDINECSSDTLNLCVPKTGCVNTDGNYICSCTDDHQLDADGRTCITTTTSTTTSTTTTTTAAPTTTVNTPPASGSKSLVFRITFDLVYVTINVTTFSTSFSTNVGSFIRAVNQLNSKFSAITVYKISSGSTIVDFSADFNSDLTNEEKALATNAIYNEIKDNSLVVDGSPRTVMNNGLIMSMPGKQVVINSVCTYYREIDFCGSNGACEEVGSVARCSCTGDYTGTQCDQRSSSGDDDSAVVIAAVLGSIGGLLALAVIIGICCIMHSKSKNEQKRRRKRLSQGSDEEMSADYYNRWYSSMWPFRYFYTRPAYTVTDPRLTGYDNQAQAASMSYGYY